jgi:hypothetical protein
MEGAADRHRSLRAVKASAASFQAYVHPYVVDKTKKCIKPILVAVVLTYLVGRALTLPIRIIALLVHWSTFGFAPTNLLANTLNHWVHDAVAAVPLFAMLIVRSYVRHPMHKTFIHVLRDVDPQLATFIEEAPPAQYQGGAPSQSKARRSYSEKVLRFIAISAFIYIWRQIPYVGRLSSPVMHYLTTRKTLGQNVALVTSVLGLIPATELLIVRFVEVWRAAHLLAGEVLDSYVTHRIPPEQRSAWFRQHDVTLALFLAPHVMLMSIPIVGPLLFVGVQGAAAYLADLLANEAPTKPKSMQDVPMQPPPSTESSPARPQLGSQHVASTADDGDWLHVPAASTVPHSHHAQQYASQPPPSAQRLH